MKMVLRRPRIPIAVLCFLRAAPFFLVTAGLAGSCGCSCEGAENQKNGAETGKKQVEAAALNPVPVQIFPVEESKIARPVQIVLAGVASVCETVRAERKNQAHVICLPDDFTGSDELAEVSMREGLRQLKEQQQALVSGSPVHLVADEKYSRLGLQLMLREPRIFGHGYLPGTAPGELTSTLLYALFSHGAQTLIIGDELPPERAPLRTMAARGGLVVEQAGRGPGGLTRALGLLQQRDPRLSASELASPVDSPAPSPPPQKNRAVKSCWSTYSCIRKFELC